MIGTQSAESSGANPLGRKDLLISLLVTLALSIPFLGKPIHIDDPVTLQVTANIVRAPADPLAGRMDWFGHELPLWEVTTNPPFLSYWLAPVVAWLGASEPVLHAAMAPFLFALAVGLRSLSGRFTSRGWLPALFALANPAVWVSVNLMRDVPAAALVCAGLALFVAGVDRGHRFMVVGGALLCGLAIVTKYSAVVSLPLLALYPLARRRGQMAVWATPALVPMAAWCLLTWLQYGWVHPLYLLSGAHSNRTFPFFDQALAAVPIVGSCLFLAPPLWTTAFRCRRWIFYEATLAGVAACSAAWFYRGAPPRPQALIWSLCGMAILWITLRDGLSRGFRREVSGAASDAFFLFCWACGFLLFSVVLAPFQAVRHVLPALPPLTFLAFRFLDRGETVATGSATLLPWLLLQATLAGAINLADADYAASYRDFAQFAAQRWKPKADTIWYVGHWGWKYYADQAGFRPLHREGPFPKEGDLLLWPERVHIGDALQDWAGYRDRLQLIESREYDSPLPIRTMNFKCAAFYAVVRDNIPYCFQSGPLERFRVYRVVPLD